MYGAVRSLDMYDCQSPNTFVITHILLVRSRQEPSMGQNFCVRTLSCKLLKLKRTVVMFDG